MTSQKMDEKSRNTKPKQDNDQIGSDFEDAIQATKLGLFNVYIMFVNFFPNFSQVTETMAMSFVLPIAQCDLNLSLDDKGVLNSVTFTGMIVSGFAWGYLCDTLGRKAIMVYGYLANGILALVLAFSPNVTMLLVLKFFTGFIINGPFSAAATHLTEFHSKNTRARIQVFRGISLSVGNMILPLLAWAILPRQIELSVMGYTVHSWNLFLLVCALPPLLSAICFALLPESPKFLMSVGKNDEALKVFQKMYRINTRKDITTYPVTCLQDEKPSNKQDLEGNTSNKHSLLQGFHQLKELFRPPYIWNVLLACGNVFLLCMSSNTIKLWLPQIFQAVNDYEALHNTTSDLCTMVAELTPTNASSVCTVNLDNGPVYLNSIIVSIARALGLSVTGFFVYMVGTKRLSIICSLITGTLLATLHMASNSLMVTSLSSAAITSGHLVETLLTTITMELFPTTCRTMAFSLFLMCGRLGGIVGITLFPFLLYTGCSVPFYYMGALVIGCAGLSILYPNVENKALK